MRSELFNRARTSLAVVFMAAIAAGCSGGGGSPPGGVAPVPPAPAPATSAPAGTAPATFTIVWPQGSTASSKSRRPAYLSKSTASLTISVADANGTVSPLVDVDNPNVGTGTTTATPVPSTTTIVQAPVGSDTFTVRSYDMIGGKGNELSDATVVFAIVRGAGNVVPLTLNGNLGKIACQAVAPFVTGTDPTYTLVGPAGQLSVIPEDADGNIIVGNGTSPTVTLRSPDASKALVTASSTPNLWNINILTVGTATALTASGTSLLGATITSTCNVTRVLALYVSNHGINNIGNSTTGPAASTSSVEVFPATATGNATPTAIIAGPNSQQSGVQFLAVDNAGNVFVSNQGPNPTATYGPTAGYVSIYGPAANGDVAPASAISGLNSPEGLALDSNGMLYVMSIDRIQEYPAAQNGVSAPAIAANTIAGPKSSLFSCYGLAVGADFSLYAGCSNAFESFKPNATGNVAPAIFEVPGNTAMTFSSQSWLGIAVDASGNAFVPAANNNLNLVDEYTAAQIAAATPGVVSTPPPTVASNGFNEPYGIAIDPSGKFYIANYGSSTVEIFSSTTTLMTGVADFTIAGANTGLSQPYGVTVR